MKHVFAIAILLFAANVASAKTYCSISTNQSKEMVFDRSLFNAEVSSPKYVLVKKDLQIAEEIQLSKFDTYEKWKAIDGEMFVTFGAQPDGQYGITFGHVDISKSENMLSLDAIIIGSVAEQKFLNLMLPQKKLSLTCVFLK